MNEFLLGINKMTPKLLILGELYTGSMDEGAGRDPGRAERAIGGQTYLTQYREKK
jgi:hypothetical protein